MSHLPLVPDTVCAQLHVATRLEPLLLDRNAESLNFHRPSVLSGRLVRGAATRLSHSPLDQDIESEEPPTPLMVGTWRGTATGITMILSMC